MQSDGERTRVEADIKRWQGDVHDWDEKVNKYLQELNRLEPEKEKDGIIVCYEWILSCMHGVRYSMYNNVISLCKPHYKPPSQL